MVVFVWLSFKLRTLNSFNLRHSNSFDESLDHEFVDVGQVLVPHLRGRGLIVDELFVLGNGLFNFPRGLLDLFVPLLLPLHAVVFEAEEKVLPPVLPLEDRVSHPTRNQLLNSLHIVLGLL